MEIVNDTSEVSFGTDADISTAIRRLNSSQAEKVNSDKAKFIEQSRYIRRFMDKDGEVSITYPSTNFDTIMLALPPLIVLGDKVINDIQSVPYSSDLKLSAIANEVYNLKSDVDYIHYRLTEMKDNADNPPFELPEPIKSKEKMRTHCCYICEQNFRIDINKSTLCPQCGTKLQSYECEEYPDPK